MSWSDIAPAPNVAGTHSYLAVRSPWGRPSAFVPPSRPNSRIFKQRNHQLEPLRGRAAQGARKNAARFKREIEFDRRRPRKFTQQIIDTIMVNS